MKPVKWCVGEKEASKVFLGTSLVYEKYIPPTLEFKVFTEETETLDVLLRNFKFTPFGVKGKVTIKNSQEVVIVEDSFPAMQVGDVENIEGGIQYKRSYPLETFEEGEYSVYVRVENNKKEWGEASNTFSIGSEEECIIPFSPLMGVISVEGNTLTVNGEDNQASQAAAVSPLNPLANTPIAFNIEVDGVVENGGVMSGAVNNAVLVGDSLNSASVVVVANSMLVGGTGVPNLLMVQIPGTNPEIVEIQQGVVTMIVDPDGTTSVYDANGLVEVETDLSEVFSEGFLVGLVGEFAGDGGGTITATFSSGESVHTPEGSVDLCGKAIPKVSPM